ncbi:anhydro-N-acetylmuramic acid kinase [Alcanivorax hongdengensis A-11-3]|uniref:Anhydro-N-acetylmuramic acid kinase n=1 Tax=Alcanivorax hongdengensis A-11-3 TaxID=1177179 RepID=L0WF17_9GAMM|nr:anhydro-N-acetylmuramic acid kinase [Alcanivorax hongdengensis]EKF75319.1 anhydro-N-acetylmuramic acid kinase [Alcanivorax hongdengensis A-11-3]
MTSDRLFVGLMTGTSVDGIDAVLARIGEHSFELIDTLSAPLTASLREAVLALCQPGDNEIDRAGPLHRALGRAYADATEQLLRHSGVAAGDIAAIGCHGQTVRHRPGHDGFSLQLGCPDTLAALTGIAVVHNFRNKDMVLGGQGAPLVPRFHARLFARPGQRLAVANIGGMANVTLLDDGQLRGGFDTGPGNVLMDHWCQQHQGHAFDRDGAWAASAVPDPALLATLLSDPYFRQPPPKSTGREHFDAHWLHRQLPPGLPPEQVQATLAELTARSLAEALSDFAPQQLWVCGGGAHNRHLLQRLAALMHIDVVSTATQGLAPDWVEAAAFAWLAWARLTGTCGNAPVVTGASREAILGQITLP